jgi:peptidoglycan/LPS O-acetylase OafA/YrhL
LIRLHQLDGLRAVACLLVLAAHSCMAPISAALEARGAHFWAVELSRLAQSGVELFFVLSGIVLLRPYVHGGRPFDLRQYARRRAERLFPPYWTCLALALPLLLVAPLVPTWYSQEIVPTFHIWDLVLQMPLFSFTRTSYNGAWWSLQVELVFYVLVPALIYVLRRPRIGWLPVAAAAAVVWGVSAAAFLQFQRCEFPPPAVRTLQFFALYSPCFLMGCLVARFELGPGGGWLLLVAGLAGVLVLPFGCMGVYPVAYSLFYGGILTLALQPGRRFERVLSHPLLVWLGERSYSLFLVHCTVFYAVNYVVSLVVAERNWAYGLLTRLVGIPLAFLAAMLVFHVVERPFARGLVTADHFWPFRFVSRHTAPQAVAQAKVV